MFSAAAVMVCQVALSLLICSSSVVGRKSIPNMRDAYSDSPVMVFSLPRSRMIDASLLNIVKIVVHDVCGSPSMILLMGKKSRSYVDAVTSTGCSLDGSSHDAVSSPAVVVVDSGGVLEVDEDGWVEVTGIVVVVRTMAVVVVSGDDVVEVDVGSVVTAGIVVVLSAGMVVVLVGIDEVVDGLDVEAGRVEVMVVNDWAIPEISTE